MTESLRILGAMTGTSCDGLDAACIEVGPDGWHPLWTATAPYPAKLRKHVLSAQLPGVKHTVRSLLELNRDLGEWYGQVLGKVLASNPTQAPDVIANHGQTVAHHPATKRQGVTLQLGDPTRIAHLTGLTVVADFRSGDVSAGGERAPLAPMFHKVLARKLDPRREGIAIHNIGGISNLTYVGSSSTLAFDTGPGNIWIDAAAEKVTRGRLKFDRGGKIASTGEADTRAIERALKDPYFRKKPPKSTGRDDFPFSMLLKATRARGADLVATATDATAESIGRAYQDFVLGRGFPLKSVFITGGGARNPHLLTRIGEKIPSVAVRPLSDVGFDGHWVEAQAFAYFGMLSLLGQPVGGEWTGARGFAPAGHIVPGKNWGAILSKLRNIDPKAVAADSI